jgi:hypothetical protein
VSVYNRLNCTDCGWLFISGIFAGSVGLYDIRQGVQNPITEYFLTLAEHDPLVIRFQVYSSQLKFAWIIFSVANHSIIKVHINFIYSAWCLSFIMQVGLVRYCIQNLVISSPVKNLLTSAQIFRVLFHHQFKFTWDIIVIELQNLLYVDMIIKCVFILIVIHFLSLFETKYEIVYTIGGQSMHH